jgi:hypothetical protein
MDRTGGHCRRRKEGGDKIRLGLNPGNPTQSKPIVPHFNRASV